MAGILADPAQRTRHVDALARFAADGDYAGLDIDYEQFAFADGRDTWAATRPELGGLHRRAVATPARRWAHADREHPAGVRRRPDQRQRLLGLRLRRHHAARRHHPRDGLRLHDAVREPRSDRPARLGARRDPLDGPRFRATRRSSSSASRCTATTGWSGRPGSARRQQRATSACRSATWSRSLPRRGATPQFDQANYEMTFTYELEVTDGATSCTQSREVHYVDANGAQIRMQDAIDGGFRGVVAVRPRLRGPAGVERHRHRGRAGRPDHRRRSTTTG